MTHLKSADQWEYASSQHQSLERIHDGSQPPGTASERRLLPLGPTAILGHVRLSAPGPHFPCGPRPIIIKTIARGYSKVEALQQPPAGPSEQTALPGCPERLVVLKDILRKKEAIKANWTASGLVLGPTTKYVIIH